MIVVEGLKPTLIGVVARPGAGGGAACGVMATLLFGVSQHDPGTFALVPLIMLAVGMIATWCRRIARRASIRS